MCIQVYENNIVIIIMKFYVITIHQLSFLHFNSHLQMLIFAQYNVCLLLFCLYYSLYVYKHEIEPQPLSVQLYE